MFHVLTITFHGYDVSKHVGGKPGDGRGKSTTIRRLQQNLPKGEPHEVLYRDKYYTTDFHIPCEPYEFQTPFLFHETCLKWDMVSHRL